MTTPITFEPKLTFLSQEDREKIHSTAMTILSDIGMFIQHEEALSLLSEAGCTIEEGDLVKISEKLVQDAIASAPSNIPVYNREGEHVMDLGGRRTYYGTGSDLIYAVDPDTKERKMATLKDVERAAHVSDALENLDFIMSFAHPSDIAPKESYLQSFATMAKNCVKPIVCTAENRMDINEMWEITCILRGSEEDARQKPYFICYDEPISPLKHPFESLEKLLFCAEKGVPCVYSPAPSSGAAAPITIAGHLAQGLAESLCGLVIHQLKAKGAPFLMGMGQAVLDMRSGNCLYNAPEGLMVYIGMIEMHHYYNLPNWGYGATSDSLEPDWQAGFEAGMMTFFSQMGGSNLCHDVGYLEFGLTNNLLEVVLCNEMIDQIRRIHQGIPINENTLALDAIRDVGLKKGDYLAHAHTFKNVRGTQWRPKLFGRIGTEKWIDQGKKSIVDRAKIKLDDILKNHKPKPIANEKLSQINNLLERFV